MKSPEKLLKKNTNAREIIDKLIMVRSLTSPHRKIKGKYSNVSRSGSPQRAEIKHECV